MNPLLLVGGIALLVLALARRARAASSSVPAASQVTREAVALALGSLIRDIRAGIATPNQVDAGIRVARAGDFLQTAASLENVAVMMKLGDLDEATRERLFIAVAGHGRGGRA